MLHRFLQKEKEKRDYIALKDIRRMSLTLLRLRRDSASDTNCAESNLLIKSELRLGPAGRGSKVKSSGEQIR